MAMSLQTPDGIRTLQRKLYLKTKAEPFYLLYHLGLRRWANSPLPRCATPDSWRSPPLRSPAKGARSPAMYKLPGDRRDRWAMR